MVTITYRVQTRYRDKTHWRTRYHTQNRTQAELLYRGINIGNGFQKRLMAEIVSSTDGTQSQCLSRSAS